MFRELQMASVALSIILLGCGGASAAPSGLERFEESSAGGYCTADSVADDLTVRFGESRAEYDEEREDVILRPVPLDLTPGGPGRLAGLVIPFKMVIWSPGVQTSVPRVTLTIAFASLARDGLVSLRLNGTELVGSAERWGTTYRLGDLAPNQGRNELKIIVRKGDDGTPASILTAHLGTPSQLLKSVYGYRGRQAAGEVGRLLVEGRPLTLRPATSENGFRVYLLREADVQASVRLLGSGQ